MHRFESIRTGDHSAYHTADDNNNKYGKTEMNKKIIMQ